MLEKINTIMEGGGLEQWMQNASKGSISSCRLSAREGETVLSALQLLLGSATFKKKIQPSATSVLVVT